MQREERELLFADFIKEKEKKEREAKKAERRRRMAAFRALLEKTSSIKVQLTDAHNYSHPPCVSVAAFQHSASTPCISVAS